MASFLSAFSIKIKGEDGVVFREIDPNRDGVSNFRLALRQVATVQMKTVDTASRQEIWQDLDTFTDISLAAMIAYDSFLHGCPVPWTDDADKVKMPEPESESSIMFAPPRTVPKH
jgi:hypothetical protein